MLTTRNMASNCQIFIYFWYQVMYASTIYVRKFIKFLIQQNIKKILNYSEDYLLIILNAIHEV